MLIPVLKFKRLPNAGDLPLPTKATFGAAGMDIRLAVDQSTIFPGEVAMACTGFAAEVPPGYELQVRGRSGLGKKGITIAQGLGTIDCDYRGEIFVPLLNTRSYGEGEGWSAKRGERIAQLVLCKLVEHTVEEVVELSATARGDAGFGSTGGR